MVAQDVEGAGAYRKLADCMREAVIGLGTRRPPPARINANDAVLMAPSELEPHDEKAHHESHKERRRAHRAGGRAKG
jgi:hypothetical protein